MSCFNKRGMCGRLLAVTLAFAALLSGGCREADNTLGLGFVPGDQEMVVRDTVFTDMITTYMAKADSVPYSNQGLFYLGSLYDPAFGRSIGGGMLQYYPTDFDDEDDTGYFGFGYEPVADSAKLVLFIASYTRRNTSVEQKFNVYRMTTLMDADSTYYGSVDLDGLYDDADPLFSFTLKDVSQSSTLSLKLEPTDAGRRYMQELVDVPEKVYSDTAAYRDLFKGLYIAPAPDSPEDADMFTALLYNDETGYISSAFEIYAHNFDEETSEVMDTVRHTYHFSDQKIGFDQLSIATLARDYTGTPLADLKYAAFDTVAPAGAEYVQPELYFQTGVGVFPFINIDDKLLAAIDGLKPSPDYDILVNQAVVRFPLAANGPADDMDVIYELDRAPGRLGMYYSYNRSFVGIPDYDFYSEKNSSTVLPYGGKLDRLWGRYTMNISSYMTRLLRSRESDQPKPAVPVQRTIALGADFYTMQLFHNQVRLAGKGFAGDGKIELKLIYTLIPKLK